MKNRFAVLAASWLTLIACQPSHATEAETPVTDDQLSMLMFVDYGRSYGYQSMMARIQLETIKAEMDRDDALLKQKEELYKKKTIPIIELEVARLKDVWNDKQLIVAEKSLEFVSAEYEAMSKMAQHFGGIELTVEEIYGVFRRGWEAGCEKGPYEVEAMRAWTEYATKSLERARQLHQKGTLPISTVLEREAQLKIARSNYENRLAGLDRCREVLFPSLQEVMAIGHPANAVKRD